MGTLRWQIEYAACAASDCLVLAGDSKPGVLMRVRQKAMRVDSINGNSRMYPRSVVCDAIERAREKARAGVMVSEMRHPEVVKLRGDDYYVDNPGAKTATVDDIVGPDADGWVWVDRSIRDTPAGRIVASRLQTQNPLGISTRFKMKGYERRVDGRPINCANFMDLHTWDDVEDPAFQGAGEFVLLNDSQLAELAGGDASGADSAFKPTQGTQIMRPEIKKALNALHAKIATRASAEVVFTARKAVGDAMEEACDKEDESGDMDLAEAGKKVAEADAMMKLAGYTGSRQSPTGTPGAETGTPGDPGFAPDAKDFTHQKDPKLTDQDVNLKKNDSGAAKTDGLTPDELAEFRASRDSRLKAEADTQMKAAIDSAMTASADALRGFSVEQKDYVIRQVREKAASPDAVPALLSAEADALSKILARNVLNSNGLGTTVNDPASTYQPARVTNEAKPWMAHTERILAAADDFRRASAGFDPDSAEVKKLRAYNRPFVNQMIEEFAQRHHNARTSQEWFNASDSLHKGDEKALCDAIEKASAASDSVTTSNLFNQPSISAALIIQQFQDLTALQFCHGIGPGIVDGSGGAGGFQMFPDSTGQIGSVLRVPTEYYTAPSGYGTMGGTYDAGLAAPENTGIDEATINIAWQSFAPTARQIAVSLTRQAIRAMGNGPLNYGAVARALFHIAYDKSRRIDKGLYDEMLQASDEYGAVAVVGESVNLADNTVAPAAGLVTVNLNPTKLAVAAAAATDPIVTYGANVIAAARLKASGLGNASPYAGTLAGVTPICRPRTKIDLDAHGAITTTTVNGLTVTAPGAMVEGYLDGTGQVQDKPGAAGSTFAVDYNNGVIVFKSGIANAGGVSTTAITVSYSYITNYDNFVVNNPTLATGETPSAYYNRLFNQIDVTASLMGSAPRYVKPNLMLGSLNAATWITAAQIFYALQSPSGTNLFPTENFFFERTGVKGARHNAPWNAKDSALLMLRNGSTKYAIDTPFEVRGPFPAYDSNGKIIPKDVYYGWENSVIATPQVTDQSGTTLNPVSRKILLR